jgi:hypothetical protein
MLAEMPAAELAYWAALMEIHAEEYQAEVDKAKKH